MPEQSPARAWVRYAAWLNQHRTAARLTLLTVALALFLVILPAGVRIFFWDSLQSNKILAGMLTGFSLLAVSLLWTAGQRIDTAVLSVFNIGGRQHQVGWDRLMLALTQLGSGVASFLISVGLFLAGDRLLAYEVMLGTLTLWIMVEFLKFVINRARPFIHLAETRTVGGRAIGLSFPSGHTSQAFFLATLLVQQLHPGMWLGLVFYALALVVGVTRMYVGAHYPRDVLAGAILGSAWGLLTGMVEGYAGFGGG